MSHFDVDVPPALWGRMPTILEDFHCYVQRKGALRLLRRVQKVTFVGDS